MKSAEHNTSRSSVPTLGALHSAIDTIVIMPRPPKYAAIPSELPPRDARIFTAHVDIPKQPLPNVIPEAQCNPRFLYEMYCMGHEWEAIYDKLAVQPANYTKWRGKCLQRIARWRADNYILHETAQSGDAFDKLVAAARQHYSDTELFFGVVGTINLTNFAYVPALGQWDGRDKNLLPAVPNAPSPPLPAPREPPQWFRNRGLMQTTLDTWLQNNPNILAHYPQLQVAPAAAPTAPTPVNPVPTISIVTAIPAPAPANSAPTNTSTKRRATKSLHLTAKRARKGPGAADIASMAPISSPPTPRTTRYGASIGPPSGFSAAPSAGVATVNRLPPRPQSSIQSQHERHRQILIEAAIEHIGWPFPDLTPDEFYDAQEAYVRGVEAPRPAPYLPYVRADTCSQADTEQMVFLQEAHEITLQAAKLAFFRLAKMPEAERNEEQAIREANLAAAKAHCGWMWKVPPHEFFEVEMMRELAELEAAGVDHWSVDMGDGEEIEEHEVEGPVPGERIMSS